MTIDECIRLAKNHMERALGGRDQADFEDLKFDPEQMRRAGVELGVRIPETWLTLLPYFIEILPCNFDDDHHCGIHPPARLIKYNKDREPPTPSDPPYEQMLTNRWLEFGSTDCGDMYSFDLQSSDLPKDARVVFWNHETGKEIEAWDSVVTFAAEMLGPVLGSQPPERPWSPDQ
jgi:hypothetical protein